MQYVDTAINQVLSNFDFAFMFTINVLAYIVTRMVYAIKKGKYVNTWSKRFILMGCTVVIAVIYWLAGYDKITVIVNSAVLAPVFWDWILRPILIKFNIDYSRFEKYDDDVVDTKIETKDTIVEVKSK